MENRYNCNIVGDLLPLYYEKMVSDDTKDYVEDHLRRCTHCQTALARMQSAEDLREVQEEQEVWQNVARILRRKLRGRNIGNKIAGAVIMLLLVIGFWAQHNYFHLTGGEIPGVQEITADCTARIQRWERNGEQGFVEAGEYVLGDGEVLQLKQLLLDTSFTRKIDGGVIYGEATDNNEYFIAVNHDALGGDFLGIRYTWGWKIDANTMPGEKQYLKIDDPVAFQKGLQSILEE